jgi:cytidylate kinase
MSLVVAIDGPAGAGKSTASRELARRLGLVHVDTGAMYRALALLAQERGVAPDDGPRLAALADELEIRFGPTPETGMRVLAAGRDVTDEIRSQQVGDLASRISTHPEVRARLVALQRAAGRAAPRGAVLDGRDIGTVVFPDADLKFFLDASPTERARRRLAELAARGIAADPEAVRREIEERDRRDRTRSHSPLRPAEDAEVFDTTRLDAEEVVEKLLERCRERLRHRPGAGCRKG